ncbi:MULTISPECIES: helix-turn-helix transcriptional regulator [Paenibacillus]|uniref:AraC family transcriptional regulator n=1 Tax=Paenibacillus campinasensis TaxID=66347 RepID=A0A268F1N7_9BACL|nr:MULTISPECIES: helix-turn-helix transcriptional regulator [Paenibacillus]PAD79253.1 AraC family transcriptional regulator [Paenibacillus campinasensis]PAK54247.1 AraC family transcriptional regulator [Paenibacillus sp. 7541]
MKERIPDILAYMQASVTQDITVEQVANHFGYSKYHFSREFKRLTGFSAADYLSSLKVEFAKQALLRHEHSVTHSGYDAGYSSIGTFSTTFTRKTGLSPREYKQQVEALYSVAKKCEETDATVIGHHEAPLASETSRCLVSVRYPEGYQAGVTFVGLFHSPIPNHRPVVGVALTKKHTHLFEHIPNGTYYLLACSIEKTFNPMRYFVLDDCLRGRVQHQVRFPQDHNQAFTITLREALPEDPPIVVNVLKLLADSLKNRNA